MKKFLIINICNNNRINEVFLTASYFSEKHPHSDIDILTLDTHKELYTKLNIFKNIHCISQNQVRKKRNHKIYSSFEIIDIAYNELQTCFASSYDLALTLSTNKETELFVSAINTENIIGNWLDANYSMKSSDQFSRWKQIPNYIHEQTLLTSELGIDSFSIYNPKWKTNDDIREIFKKLKLINENKKLIGVHLSDSKQTFKIDFSIIENLIKDNIHSNYKICIFSFKDQGNQKYLFDLDEKFHSAVTLIETDEENIFDYIQYFDCVLHSDINLKNICELHKIPQVWLTNSIHQAYNNSILCNNSITLVFNDDNLKTLGESDLIEFIEICCNDNKFYYPQIIEKLSMNPQLEAYLEFKFLTLDITQNTKTNLDLSEFTNKDIRSWIENEKEDLKQSVGLSLKLLKNINDYKNNPSSLKEFIHNLTILENIKTQNSLTAKVISFCCNDIDSLQGNSEENLIEIDHILHNLKLSLQKITLILSESAEHLRDKRNYQNQQAET